MHPQQGFAKSGMVRKIEATMGPRLRAAYPVSLEIPDRFLPLLRLLDTAADSVTGLVGDLGDAGDR